MTITDLYKPLNIKKLKFQIPVPNTNKVTVFYSVLLIPDHCLCAYRIVGDNVYSLGKLVPCGSIFILRSFFSCTFFGCLRSNERGVAFGEEIIIFWN